MLQEATRSGARRARTFRRDVSSDRGHEIEMYSSSKARARRARRLARASVSPAFESRASPSSVSHDAVDVAVDPSRRVDTPRRFRRVRFPSSAIVLTIFLAETCAPDRTGILQACEIATEVAKIRTMLRSNSGSDKRCHARVAGPTINGVVQNPPPLCDRVATPVAPFCLSRGSIYLSTLSRGYPSQPFHAPYNDGSMLQRSTDRSAARSRGAKFEICLCVYSMRAWLRSRDRSPIASRRTEYRSQAPCPAREMYG